MLFNIKMLMGIDATDTTKDAWINWHIKMVTQAVCNLIKMEYLPSQLEGVVEKKVIQLCQGGLDTNRVTQIDRGDYKIKYSFEGKNDKSLLSDMMGDLRPFMKKVRYV